MIKTRIMMSYYSSSESKIKFVKDVADLVTTLIIIAGLSVAAIVAIGGITLATKDNAKKSADCVANYSAFNKTTDISDDCKGIKDDGENEENEENNENIPLEEENSSNNECFLLEETGSIIIGYKIELEECSTDVIIPSEINNIEITTIDDYAFNTVKEQMLARVNPAYDPYDVRNKLTSVVIPDTITTIGDYAFYNNSLTTINIPNSVTSLGYSAFSKNQLTSVDIPNSVTIIQGYTFDSNKLTSITIPNSVTHIGENAFNHNKLSSIFIPESVERINRFAFTWNPLTNITMSYNTIIDTYAFSETHYPPYEIITPIECSQPDYEYYEEDCV